MQRLVQPILSDFLMQFWFNINIRKKPYFTAFCKVEVVTKFDKDINSCSTTCTVQNLQHCHNSSSSVQIKALMNLLIIVETVCHWILWFN